MSKSEYEIKKAFFLSFIADNWKSTIISLLLISFFSFAILHFSLAERKEIKMSGKVVGLTASQDDDGHIRYLIVLLENSNQVLVPLHKSVLYKKKCPVLIKKIVRDSLIETIQYKFLRYTGDCSYGMEK